MVLIQEKILSELSEAIHSHPDMYIGDLIEYVVHKYHPSRKFVQPYYINKLTENYPITNQVLLDALVKYNKHRGKK